MNAKQYILENGWEKAEQVAKAAGTNRAYFSHIAHGHKNASVKLADRLVKASGGDLDFASLIRATEDRRVAVK